MSVVRLLDRVKTGIEQVLLDRCAPEDEIEFDAGLGIQMIHVQGEGPDDDDKEYRNVSVISIYVSMKMPEHGPTARCISHILVPVRGLEEVHEIHEIGTDLWNTLQANRMMAGLDEEIDQKVLGDDQNS